MWRRARAGSQTQVMPAEDAALPPLLAEYDRGAAFDPTNARLAGNLADRFFAKDGVSPNPDDEVMILRLPRTPRNLDIKLLECDWRPGDVW